MNKKLTQFADVLFEPVKGFERLRAAEFEQRFEDDVAELDEVSARTWRWLPGIGEIIELSNGYNIHIDLTSRWSLFEGEAHHNERTLFSAWAAFIRGCWTNKVPKEPGVYFVRDRDLGKRSTRELQRVNGRLLDVSGGLVPPGSVTCWCGMWWSEKIPNLPESY